MNTPACLVLLTLVGLLGPLAAVGRAGDAKSGPAAARPSDLVGDWLFVEDRTPGTDVPLARRSPAYGSALSIRLEEGVVTLERTRAGPASAVRFRLDGKALVVTEAGKTVTHVGRFEDGALTTSRRSKATGEDERVITAVETTYTPTPEGLLVHFVMTEPSRVERVGLYRRKDDIPPATAAKAEAVALAWLAGGWSGAQGKAALEERWSPVAGGALLGTARTVASGRMKSFEFLRIVERDGGLVYVAQPGGVAPTEFVLTELTDTRAVFENPHHDFPKRIVYEREGEEGLVTEISDAGGVQAMRATYRREAP